MKYQKRSFNFFKNRSTSLLLSLTLIFFVALIGTVSAIENTGLLRNVSQVYVFPYGYLPSGTSVTSIFSINVLGVYPSDGEERYLTDLDHPNWTYTIIVNGVQNLRPVVSGNNLSLLGFELNYKQSDVVSVNITLQGEATMVDSPLKNFTIVRTESYDSNGTLVPGSVVTVEGQTAATHPPVTNFTAHPTYGAAPLDVFFNDFSTNYPSSWNWSFGDGTWFNYSGLIPRNPIHTYYGYGTYAVSLTTTNSEGSTTTTKPDFITVTDTYIGVYRPATHIFYQDYNGNGAWNGAVTDRANNFGLTGDIPVSGDWNLDGRTEIGVFRPSTHMFYLDYNGNGAWNGAVTDRTYNFGLTGDIPVSGDWNLDRTTEIGVFRPSTHMFYLDYNGNGAWNGAVTDRTYNFGLTGDIPVSGDWNLDGTTEIGVFRSSTHMFYLDYNRNGLWNGAVVDRAYSFGLTGDIPVSGDWNLDGRNEIGVFRPSTHSFYLDVNGNGVWNGAVIDRAYNFGITGDIPISGKWSSIPQPSVTITFNKNLTITPGTTVNIPVGGKVIWKNEDPYKPHGVVAVNVQTGQYFGGMSIITIPYGQAFEVTFTTAGTYDYQTTFQPSVVGKVIVTA